VQSLEVMITLVAIMFPCGMLLFLLYIASNNSVTRDLAYLDWSLLTLHSLSIKLGIMKCQMTIGSTASLSLHLLQLFIYSILHSCASLIAYAWAACLAPLTQ
jgi:hypothetical protein